MLKCRAYFSPSPALGVEPPPPPLRLIAASLADWRRVMSAIEKQNANRDRVWPRNYRCWIRAPEPADLLSSAVKRNTKREFHHEKHCEALGRTI
jgi:hypothetical protein